MRVRTIALVGVVALAGLLRAAPVGAQEDDHTDEGEVTTTPTSIPDGIGLQEGIFVTGAVVTPPDGEPRTMDELEAAIFVQSWIGAAFFCPDCEQREPPPELPVYRIDASGTWVGAEGNVTAYYATDGTTAYIAFPGIEVWTDPAAIPEPSQWFIPPARVIDAFNGEAELIPTTGIETATSVPGPAEEEEAAASDDGSDSSSPWPWVGGAVVLAAALTGGGLLLRRRRAQPV